MNTLELFLCNANHNEVLQRTINDKKLEIDELIIKINCLFDIFDISNVDKTLDILKSKLKKSNFSTLLRKLIIDYLDNRFLLSKADFKSIITNLDNFAPNLDLKNREGTFHILNLFLKCEAMFRRGLYKENLSILNTIIQYMELNKLNITLDNKFVIGMAYRIAFMSHFYMGNIELASRVVEEGLAIFKKFKNNYYSGKFYNSFGILKWNRGELNLALKYFSTSLKLFKSIGDLRYIHGIKNNVAIIYKDQGKLNLSIKYLLEIIQAYEDMNKSPKDLSLMYDNLGCIYRDIGKFKLAKHYLYKSYSIRKNSSDAYEKSVTLLNITILQEKLNLLSDNSISLTEFPDDDGESDLLLVNKLIIDGIYLLFKKEYFKALHQFKVSIKYVGIDFRFRLLVFEYIAECYLELNQFDLLNEHFVKWRKLVEGNNLKPSLMKFLLISAKLEILLFNLDRAENLLQECFTIGFTDLPLHSKLAEQLKKTLESRKKLFKEMKDKKSSDIEIQNEKKNVISYIKELDKHLISK